MPTSTTHLLILSPFFLSSLLCWVSPNCATVILENAENPIAGDSKKSMGFDLLLQSEEKLKLSSRIDDLPLKGGVELRAEYEFLQFELKKMAPPNGKAVLLFRAPCGCPVSKLEALGPKGSRRS